MKNIATSMIGGIQPSILDSQFGKECVGYYGGDFRIVIHVNDKVKVKNLSKVPENEDGFIAGDEFTATLSQIKRWSRAILEFGYEGSFFACLELA